eukprot:6919222-Heterocapsa_arctica.AAC.1
MLHRVESQLSDTGFAVTLEIFVAEVCLAKNLLTSVGRHSPCQVHDTDHGGIRDPQEPSRRT